MNITTMMTVVACGLALSLSTTAHAQERTDEYLTSEACTAVDFVIVKQTWEKGGFGVVAL
jgi:hypothetical protein